MSDACSGCGAPAPVAARFCPVCGQRLDRAAEAPAGAEPAPPRRRSTGQRVPPRRRHPPAGSALWRQFVPALWLWGLFLLLNGALGLAGRVADLSSPWVDVADTAAMALLVVGYCARDRDAILPLLRTSGLDARTFWYPLAALGGMVVVLEAYFWGLTQLGAGIESYLDDFRSHDWPLWSAFVLVSVCPAVLEEVAFRGYIQHRLGMVMGSREAVFVQAAMFSVLHMSPLIFVSHFAMGAVLGMLRAATGSLWSGVAIHMLWNAWVLVKEIRA